MLSSEKKTILVINCARCGADHDVNFIPLTNPPDQYDWWGMCPNLHEPILMSVMKFCRTCKYLNPKEHEQTSSKQSHVCGRYHKRVFHRGFHPDIPRLSECDSYTEE